MCAQATSPSGLKDLMHARLQVGFAPEHLEVCDQSADHFGHSGWRPEGETHFHITLVSALFEGQSPIARHRAVYAQLNTPALATWHALALTLKTPAEWQARRPKDPL